MGRGWFWTWPERLRNGYRTPPGHGDRVKTTGSPLARVAAWTCLVLTVAGIAAALVLRSRAGTIGFVGELTLLGTLNALISALVGAVVIDRKGSHPVGWLFCLSGLFWTLAHIAGAAGGIVLSGGSLAAQNFLISSTGWASFLAFAMAPALIMFVFPTGRLASPRWRWPFGFACAVTAIGVVGYALAPGPMEEVPLNNPYGAGGTVGAVAMVMREAAWPLLLLSILAGVVSLRRRMKAAPLDERQQIKWLVLAGFVLFAFVSFWGTMDTLGKPEVAAAISGLFLPLLPIALGIAILKHRLYDIDVLINRTLVYLSLSAVLGAIYLSIVFLLQRALAPITADSNIAVAASTLAAAALFRPLRASIQAFINRRFYRQKYDALTTVGKYSSRVRSEIELDALTGELMALVGETLRPATVSVWLNNDDNGR